MELYWKIAVAAVLTAVLTCILAQENRASALAVSISACVVILAAGLSLFSSIRSRISEIADVAGIAGETAGCLLKVCLIGALTQLSESYCRESGALAVGKAAELCGGAAALYVSLPLVESLWTVLKKLLGG